MNTSRPLLKSFGLLALLFVVVCLVAWNSAAIVQAEDDGKTDQQPAGDTTSSEESEASSFTFEPVSTDNPRTTLNSFIRLTWIMESRLQAYRAQQTRTHYDQIQFLGPRFLQLLDLSGVPEASRREVGVDTAIYLLDIIGRLDLPPMDEVPDETVFDENEPAKWRIPGTPIRIVRIDEGPREGEFLFSSRTVDIAPWFYQRISHRPLRSTLGVESWIKFMPQLHGPLIPAGLVSILPDELKRTWLDTPIWKIVLVLLMLLIAAAVLVFWNRLLYRRIMKERVTVSLLRLLSPVSIIAVALILRPVIANEIEVTGQFAQIVDFATTLLINLSSIWAFWLLVMTITEWIILSPRIPDESLDANLLRLSARVVGSIGAILILAFGAQALGLPVLGLVAGLGVGGLAVALAIRPTLENLIGGAILYIDRPVRVGDFCTFGTFYGTVESIGVRSTQVRTLDRTLITVPNANFANMELINWGKCDMMLIRTTIGVRYETDPDQLRYLLANLREMCYAHPMIDQETVRIRFIGYGASSLNVDFRVYALTREWGEFYAIREDVYLRVNEIVAESGTSFAFPSQTLYMGRDDGMDNVRSKDAASRVDSWRKSGILPFPSPTDENIERLSNTLDFPPRGSPGVLDREAFTYEAAEPLSGDTNSQATEDEERRESAER